MPFIKVQKLVREGDKVRSGSAAVVDTSYVTGQKYHCKHVVRERLGKILYLSNDKRSGIFQSPSRGLVFYDAGTDSFSDVAPDDDRLAGSPILAQSRKHTIFGDAYLLLTFMKKQGLIPVLHSVFHKDADFQRLIGHILYGILRLGSKIPCNDFLLRSVASHLLTDVNVESFKSDSRFFTMMGDDQTRLAFFKSFVQYMRKRNPDFGRGCYVDSTPLPNDIHNNPFNALCSHGTGGATLQMRLVLVLDEESGLPVWYDIIPGNVLDLSTTMDVVNDVAVSLDIDIESLVLDAGYVSKELLNAFHIGSPKTIIGRMPARKGFPYKTLYHECKPLISRGKYEFLRNQHNYFGYRKEITVFNQPEYAYVYVDRENALNGLRKYMQENEEEYEKMLDRDKDWYCVKFGYFVLISNRKLEPREMLSEYFERTDIECVFKTSKDYLGLLPLSKWTAEAVRGKILLDIINTIIVLQLRKVIDEKGYSIPEIFGRAQSLMCNSDGTMLNIETPNKQTKEFYGLFHYPVPSHLSLADAQNLITV